MNKAFVKESDAENDRCPRCGAPGVAVSAETLAAQLPVELRSTLSSTGYFCEQPRCEVAYFDAFERAVAVDVLPAPIWPKSLEAPLCACFGLRLEDLEQDVREGGVRRVRAVVEQARTAAAQCAARSPTGRSCVADVQRAYLRLREGRSPRS